MRKILTLVVIILIASAVVFNLNIEAKESSAESQEVNIQEISDKLIRFHVIANSDTEEDQKLKLKVRDAILEYIAPKLRDSKDKEHSREILNENTEEILKISSKVIKENGYDYEVKSDLGMAYFPIKEYGDVILPAGDYEAYRVIIGSGKGENWWCVMFPALCFVDITKGEVAYEETKEEMETVLTEEEYKFVSKREEGVENQVEVKFKILEEIKEIFN